LRAAKVGRISFNEIRVEVVLPNQKAKLVPQAWLAIGRTISIVLIISIGWGWRGLGRSGGAAEFLDRAESDAIRFAQSTVYRARFRYPHLSAVDVRGHIRWIGVSEADEPA